MKGKRFIIVLLLLLGVIWAFGYFSGYIENLHGILFMFVAFSIWLLLGCIIVFQIVYLLFERQKHLERLGFTLTIIVLLVLTYIKPRGLIEWENFEAENYLVAVGRGNVLKLKPKDKVRFISANQDFYFGTYEMRDDTLFLFMKKITPYMDKISYATLQKSGVEHNSYRSLCLYQNTESRPGRCITMAIKALDIENLTN